MEARPGGGSWPSHELREPYETLVSDADELVLDGIDVGTGARVVVSMRDLGEDVSAGFWDEEVERLVHVRHPNAARVLAADIVDDRYFVVRTKVPAEALALKERLSYGPLVGADALRVLLANLEVAVELHALHLSAAGMRQRSVMEVPRAGEPPLVLVATFGLHVDNDVEVFNDLREIALRILGICGGRHERGRLILPPGQFSNEVELLFRRAVGVERPELDSAREMLDAVAVASGQKRPRTTERKRVPTRPIAQVNSVYGSDLLLAEEFLAANSIDETPMPTKRGRR